jgi:hypothetical protein
VSPILEAQARDAAKIDGIRRDQRSIIDERNGGDFEIAGAGTNLRPSWSLSFIRRCGIERKNLLNKLDQPLIGRNLAKRICMPRDGRQPSSHVLFQIDCADAKLLVR